MYQRLARRFIVCDDWHASLLGPTYPNREYLMSGQSGGNKTNAFPPTPDGFSGTTIVDGSPRRASRAAEYYSDLPMFAAVGFANAAVRLHPIDELSRATRPAGRLPNVSFVSPSFIGDETRTDDHPHGDPRAAQTVRQRRVRRRS